MNLADIKQTLNNIKRTYFGISVPELRKFAKQIAKNNHKEFIKNNDYSTFDWNLFERGERDITANPPYFVFKSPLIELRIYFNEAEKFPKKKRIRLFQNFQKELLNLGITTLDLS